MTRHLPQVVSQIRGSYKRNTMKNCNVSHSKYHGLWVENGGLMTIDGNETTIHHNCTGGDSCGLRAGYFSSIHLVSPLTKEMISTNNHGCRNTLVQFKQLRTTPPRKK